VKTMTSKIFVLLVGATALSACGGGGGGGGVSGTDGRTGPDREATYATLDSTAPGSSRFGGTALRSLDSGNRGTLVRSEGRIDRDSGSLTLTDDLYTFTDTDGSDRFGIFRDANGAEFAPATNTSATAQDYEYVSFYAGSYRVGSQSYTLVGTAGIVTRPINMPTVGRAQYTGDAIVTVAQSNGSVVGLPDGNSTVDADFAAGTVDVTLDRFGPAVDADTGQPATAPLDRITISDMAISSNGYSGGTVSVQNSGNAVNSIGGITSEQAGGTFFGYDDDILAPDETGGQLLQEGRSGALLGLWIAD